MSRLTWTKIRSLLGMSGLMTIGGGKETGTIWDNCDNDEQLIFKFLSRSVLVIRRVRWLVTTLSRHHYRVN